MIASADRSLLRAGRTLLRFLVAVVALGSAGASADPISIVIQQTLTFVLPSQFAGSSTFTGSSGFTKSHGGSFGDETFVVHFTEGDIDRPLIIGSVFNAPPPPTMTDDSIYWSLGGALASGGNSFCTNAYSAGAAPAPPPPACPVPALLIATALAPGFLPIDVGGGIWTFDDAVQIGTWEIGISQAIPEPSTLVLLCSALAALAGFLSRRHPAM